MMPILHAVISVSSRKNKFLPVMSWVFCTQNRIYVGVLLIAYFIALFVTSLHTLDNWQQIFTFKRTTTTISLRWLTTQCIDALLVGYYVVTFFLHSSYIITEALSVVETACEVCVGAPLFGLINSWQTGIFVLCLSRCSGLDSSL